MCRRRSLLLCCVLCASLACKPGAATAPSSSANDTTGASAAAAAGSATHSDICPVKVPATTVTVVSAKDGVAMYCTTLGSHVAEVRRRTAALAATATPQPVATPAADRRSVEVAAWEVAARAGVVPLRATSEEIPDGSRLILVPLDPADLDALRSYARAQGERMRLGDCPANFLEGRTKAASQAPSPDNHG